MDQMKYFEVIGVVIFFFTILNEIYVQRSPLAFTLYKLVIRPSYTSCLGLWI